MSDFGRIVGLTEEMRATAGLRNPHYSTKKLIRRCLPGVKVMGDRLPRPLIGSTRIEGDKVHIFYDRRFQPVRQREIIAHELGHVVLEPHVDGEHRCAGAQLAFDRVPENEVAADRFADELLVPLVRLAADVPIVPFDRSLAMRAAWADAIDSLASDYKVTRECIRRRLRDLAHARNVAGLRTAIGGIREALRLRDALLSPEFELPAPLPGRPRLSP